MCDIVGYAHAAQPVNEFPGACYRVDLELFEVLAARKSDEKGGDRLHDWECQLSEQCPGNYGLTVVNDSPPGTFLIHDIEISLIW
jgi:hypothetical protein